MQTWREREYQKFVGVIFTKNLRESGISNTPWETPITIVTRKSQSNIYNHNRHHVASFLTEKNKKQTNKKQQYKSITI